MRLTLSATGFLVLCLAPVVASAGVRFSQHWISFSPEDGTGSVSFTNEGNATMQLDFEAVARNKATADSAQKMLVFPPQITLKPGGRQTLRLAARKNGKLGSVVPTFYWLQYSQREQAAINAAKADDIVATGRVSLQPKIRLPIAYIKKGAKPKAQWQLKKEADGSLAGVYIANRGGAALRISKIGRAGTQSVFKHVILPGEKVLINTQGLQLPLTFWARNHAPIELR